MILGRANVDGSEEFSRTAYNMQVTSGDRKRMTADEVEQSGLAALGWKQYQKFQADLESGLSNFGLNASSDVGAAVKRQFVEWLKQNNGAWAKEYSERVDKFGYYYSQAQALSKDRRLASRSDMVAFREYDAARREVMEKFGLKSLSGTGQQSQIAKAVLAQAGQTLAARDFGFQQMWDRFLSGEVEVEA
jgi:hypothetical protein